MNHLWIICIPQKYLKTFNCVQVSCLNFWDEVCWFLSLKVFRLLSSSLLLFPQPFGRYVLRPSSGVRRTREPTRNFELPVPIMYSSLYLVYSAGDSLRYLILQYSALSIISTSFHKGRWFPFSFHIWSAIPDISILPRTNPIIHIR